MLEEDFAVMDPTALQQVYEILHKRDTLGNPLTSMMGRNLRVFAKIAIQHKKRFRKVLADWKPAPDADKLKAFMDGSELSNSFVMAGFDHPAHFYTISGQPAFERVDPTGGKIKYEIPEKVALNMTAYNSLQRQLKTGTPQSATQVNQSTGLSSLNNLSHAP